MSQHHIPASSQMKMISIFVSLFFSLILSASAHRSEKFHGLTGYRPGDTNPAIPDLKKYLHHFGYLSDKHHDPSEFTDSFDEDLHSAIRTYQLNSNLDVTGVLDPPTIGLLSTPRCGVPDIVNGTTSMFSGKLSGRLHYAFFTNNPVWPRSKRLLGYAITVPDSRFSTDALSKVFASAFGRWAAVTDFRFAEVSAAESPDITIGFYSGDHGDDFPFDEQLSTWAHAMPPTDGRFHLNKAVDWTDDVETATSERAVDLESLSVHAIGHLLGLMHSSVPEAVMYPWIPVLTRKVDLSLDDILGIHALYEQYGLRGEDGEGSRLLASN